MAMGWMMFIGRCGRAGGDVVCPRRWRKVSPVSGGPWGEDFRCEDMGAVWLDADSDGDLDLYVVSGGVECNPNDAVLQDRLYVNEGNLRFTRAQDALPKMLSSGSVVAAADFDRDGDLDLFVGGRVIPGDYPLSPDSYLLRNDGGEFSDVTDELARRCARRGFVTSAIWSDAGSDGWIDLLVTHEWGPVKLFRNETAADKGLVELGASRRAWRTCSAGSTASPRPTCNDGDMDYAVSNFGLNTKYHATPEKPVMLHYGGLRRGRANAPSRGGV